MVDEKDILNGKQAVISYKNSGHPNMGLNPGSTVYSLCNFGRVTYFLGVSPSIVQKGNIYIGEV